MLREIDRDVSVENADADPRLPNKTEASAPFYVEVRLWLKPNQMELWRAYASWSVAVMQDHGAVYMGRRELDTLSGSPDSNAVFAFPCKAAYEAYRKDIVTAALSEKRSQCVASSEYLFPDEPGKLVPMSCTPEQSCPDNG